ncbi:hypothetical protein ES319_D03G062800v1 [Gossypium barbadense]|uniref:1-aminocyclopropane-1-carboxylate oxidase 5 isoform X2 n=2 Tax=Gossypium TaxID=3633 RepID=A0A1U8NSE8_GOSHI|nr:1-aminocyclopropane-1-carboxylate oxidase 5 isoform X2 [Gossypium hirsutum]KAB2037270.1 hypothetical protein ES319_D03G062800v1 [Gossypium barbadense]
MALSPQSVPENPFDFRAPPPSPVASGRRSCVTNDEALNSMQTETLPKILDSIATIGCFQLVNYGIPVESIRSALTAAAGIFQLPPQKRTTVTRSPEKLYGFEEVHEEDEGEVSEEFVWCKAKALELAMEGIWPVGYSNFSEKMETLVAEMEKVAEKILTVFREIYQEKTGRCEKEKMEEEDGNGWACYVYKHGGNVSAEKWRSCLRYDVMKMLIGGMDYSHTLCLHICDGSSEFHVYSKKGWVSFCPHKHALVVTVGDQTQALSGGQLKHVIGRPIYRGEEEEFISMAFLYSSSTTNSRLVDPQKPNTISLSQQAIAAILFTLLYQILVYVYYKF